MAGSGPFAGGGRYNSYGAFLREKFGCRVQKVAVDAGFTCPNRDGTVAVGGCTYCNNDSFRPSSADRSLPVGRQVENGIRHLRRRCRAEKFIVYFQPFSNTYAPLDVLGPLYEEALAHEDVIGLSVGTRCDCVDEAKLGWFAELARRKFVTIEYGLESVHDRTLERINRGHDFRCFADAVSRTRDRGIFICAHLILGFPWETRDEMLESAQVVSRLGLNFLKLHHLHVARNTPMGLEYQRQPFPLMSCADYVDLVVCFLELLNPAISLERLVADVREDLLLAPRWGKGKAGIQRAIESELATRNTYQGRLYGPAIAVS